MGHTPGQRDRKLPEKIYLPTADDFCKGLLRHGDRRCSIGWMIYHFGNDRGIVPREIVRQWLETANEMGLMLASLKSIPTCNDNYFNTKQQLAECYERTVVALGYEVSDE